MAPIKDNSPDHKFIYWIALVGLFLFTMTSGIIGYHGYLIIHGEEHNFLRTLYRTLQLFNFEGGDLAKPLPWELNLARFTGPITTIMALLAALLELFKEQWQRLRISWMKNHVVIIGFGKKGKSIMEESIQNKERVLIIELDPLNPNLASIRLPRCRLILGDATNISIIRKSRITKAKSVFLLMGDDTRQINACLIIYQLIKQCSRNDSNALNCIMHLQKQDFLNTMRSHNLTQDTKDGLTVNIFNVYENSARELFEKNPPDRLGISEHSEKYVQIIIFGFGQAGEALALQTALNGHYLNGKKPHVLVVDRMAAQKIPDFLRRYPTYIDYCDLLYLDLEADSPQLIHHLSNHLGDPNALTTMVICFDNSTHNMLLGSQLENIIKTKPDDPPWLFVRINDDESYHTFTGNINPYGLPSAACSQEVICTGKLDKLSMAFHENYLIERAQKRKKDPNLPKKEAEKVWNNLSQEYKDSNRKAADHMGVKLRGIKCEIVDINNTKAEALFDPDELEKLAMLEHERWSAERSLAGWTYAKKDDPSTRKNENLVDWDILSNDTKDYDRTSVGSIPQILKLIDMKMVRR